LELVDFPDDLAQDRGKGFLVVLPRLLAPHLPQFWVPALAPQRVVLPDASAPAPQPPPVPVPAPQPPQRLVVPIAPAPSQ
jgi:hypothetical protein